ncbi:GFA family protein [Celeribacter neptunius]|uniref:Uncharacterized conserved protein n=1 Tax=Celeribacter neptunius TaxID=588602 RepID=A0A1I3WAH8_9RHOB|nr:GFA family protein [Celeribacter neptunius]SFK04400.1 Uncharacterized conserved protein [Celeribacter neptunius]
MSNDNLWRDTPAGSGGCQCGAVRYTFTAGPSKATICHCRMCQRAVGGPFAALLELPRDRISWAGAPKRFASSSKADRGFCPECGTPLFYDFHDRDVIEVTAGSLPPDFPYRPVKQWGMESRCGWLDGLPRLPGAETFETGISSNQSSENDGA